jgi:hypothetical protein
MNHPLLTSRLIAAMLACALLGAAQATPTLHAATPLSLRVPADIIVSTSSSDGTSVLYGSDTPGDETDDVVPSDPTASVSCDSASGAFFPRGETVVTCTATLGSQTARGIFSVLVAYGTDIDAQMLLDQTPASGVPASATLSYALIVQNNGPLPASQAIIDITLPAQVDLLQYATDRCTYTAKTRKMRCSINNTSIGEPYRQAVDVKVRIRKGTTGSFKLSATLSLGQGQRDMKAANNSTTITTVVRELSFGPNSLALPQIQVP